MDTRSKIKEAEVYCSMGLLSEALEVYEMIVSDASGLNAEEEEKLRATISSVKEQLAKEKESGSPNVSGEDISRMRKTLSDSGNVQALLDGAFALKELGHYEEAVTEYGRLLHLDYPTAKIVPEIAGCLTRFDSPEKAMAEVDKLLEDPKLGNKEKARMQLRIGFELEKRGDKDLALSLYHSANRIDPEDKEIEARLEALDLSLSAPIRESVDSPVNGTFPDPDASEETYEKRRESRIPTRVPDFVYVEFAHRDPAGHEKEYRLNVINYSGHGICLLVSEKDFDLLRVLKRGERIRNITFYASWALIRVDTTVRHLTKVEDGPYQDMYVIGVETGELITSAQPS